MRNFKSFYPNIIEDINTLKYTGSNENPFTLAILEDIDNQIGGINAKLEIDKRKSKFSGKKLGISAAMPDKDRDKYANLARVIISETEDLTLMMDNVPGSRKEKDFAFKHKEFKVLNEDVYNVYLTEEELRKMWDLDLTHLPKHDNARDLFPMFSYYQNAYEASEAVDAIIIGTEWNEFRALNFLKLKSLMKNLVIFDLRNIYNKQELSDLGFEYYGIGK